VEPFVCGSSSTPSDSFPSISSGDSLIKTRVLPSALNASVSSDSQYVSQGPDHLRLSTDFNSTIDQSFVVKDHSQMRHLGQFAIPKLMRDDFMVLTKANTFLLVTLSIILLFRLGC
jgi:hypothetical protein